jgi:hypothetical protein
MLIRDLYREGMPTYNIHDSNSMSEVVLSLVDFNEDFNELLENIYAVALLTTTRVEFNPL